MDIVDKVSVLPCSGWHSLREPFVGDLGFEDDPEFRCKC